MCSFTHLFVTVLCFLPFVYCYSTAIDSANMTNVGPGLDTSGRRGRQHRPHRPSICPEVCERKKRNALYQCKRKDLKDHCAVERCRASGRSRRWDSFPWVNHRGWACVRRSPSPSPSPSPTPSSSITPSPSPSSSVSPSPIPTSAYAHCAGDPHVRTFDGAHFDCMGRGEFILARSRHFKPEFELQGRFEGVSRVSVTTGIVMEHEKAPKVQISRIESDMASSSHLVIGSCKFGVFLNRKLVRVDRSRKTFKKRGKKVDIEFTGTRINLYYRSGMRIVTEIRPNSHFGCFMSLVQLMVPGHVILTAKISGLFGSPDNNLLNDIQARNRRKIILGGPRDISGTEYCRKVWCVQSRFASHFTYEDNTNFEYYHKCGYRVLRPRFNERHVPPGVRNICGTDKSCMLDGLVGGPQMARDYLKAIYISEQIGRDGGGEGPSVTNAPVARFPVDGQEYVSQKYNYF